MDSWTKTGGYSRKERLYGGVNWERQAKLSAYRWTVRVNGLVVNERKAKCTSYRVNGLVTEQQRE